MAYEKKTRKENNSIFEKRKKKKKLEFFNLECFSIVFDKGKKKELTSH
jgi:hypothetical protein